MAGLSANLQALIVRLGECPTTLANAVPSESADLPASDCPCASYCVSPATPPVLNKITLDSRHWLAASQLDSDAASCKEIDRSEMSAPLLLLASPRGSLLAKRQTDAASVSRPQPLDPPPPLAHCMPAFPSPQPAGDGQALLESELQKSDAVDPSQKTTSQDFGNITISVLPASSHAACPSQQSPSAAATHKPVLSQQLWAGQWTQVDPLGARPGQDSDNPMTRALARLFSALIPSQSIQRQSPMQQQSEALPIGRVAAADSDQPHPAVMAGMAANDLIIKNKPPRTPSGYGSTRGANDPGNPVGYNTELLAETLSPRTKGKQPASMVLEGWT